MYLDVRLWERPAAIDEVGSCRSISELLDLLDRRGEIGVCDEDPLPTASEHSGPNGGSLSEIPLVCEEADRRPSDQAADRAGGLVVAAIVHN